MAATRLASLSRGGIRGVRHGENVLELEQERFQPFKKGQEVGGFAGHSLGGGGGAGREKGEAFPAQRDAFVPRLAQGGFLPAGRAWHSVHADRPAV